MKPYKSTQDKTSASAVLGGTGHDKQTARPGRPLPVRKGVGVRSTVRPPAPPGRAFPAPALAADKLPSGNQPSTTVTIRLGTGEYVEIRCRRYPDGLMAIHTGRRGLTDCESPVSGGTGQQEPAEVVTLTRAGFLTTTGRRGAAASTILDRGGVDLASAVTVADALDLLSAAALRSAGISRPDDARAVLAALWAP